VPGYQFPNSQNLLDSEPGMVAHTFDPSRQISEFEASLVYKVSSWIARAIQRNPVSKNKKKKKKISWTLKNSHHLQILFTK
jgi:hypothetical protein